MSGSNSAISRRRLLKGAGAMWLLSVSQVGLAAVSQVVVWGGDRFCTVKNLEEDAGKADE